MAWYPILGGAVFWISLLAAILIYVFKRKFYPISYLISGALYVFTIGFVIDVFDLSKNWILFLLGLSSVIMILLGTYLAELFQNTPKKAKTKKKMKKNLLGIWLPLVLLIIILSLSVSNIGYTFHTQTIEAIKLQDLFPGEKSIKVQEINVTNNFILPKGVELPSFAACLYNEQYNQYEFLPVEYRQAVLRKEVKPTLDYALLPVEGDRLPSFDVGIFETKTIQLMLNTQNKAYPPKPEILDEQKYYNQTVQRYKQYFSNQNLLLVPTNSLGYYEYDLCYQLDTEQKNNAIKIKII